MNQDLYFVLEKKSQLTDSVLDLMKLLMIKEQTQVAFQKEIYQVKKQQTLWDQTNLENLVQNQQKLISQTSSLVELKEKYENRLSSLRSFEQKAPKKSIYSFFCNRKRKN